MDFEHTRYNDKTHSVLCGFSLTVVKNNVVVFFVMTSCCNLVNGWDVLLPSLTESLCSPEAWDLLTNVQRDNITHNVTKCILCVFLSHILTVQHLDIFKVSFIHQLMHY